MKCLYSLIFLASFNLYARDVILLENLASLDEGKLVIKILKEKFHIPQGLITFKATLTCSKESDAIMQLCLKQNGELEIVKMNRFVIENSLRAFSEMEKENDRE